MDKIFASILISFSICIAITPVVLKFIKSLKAGQPILHYVESHKSKTGTPTMGGIIFIIGITLASFIMFGINNSLATVVLVVMLCFGILGFLDDYIKVKYKQNEGLKPYQKLVGQLAIATIIAFYAYNSAYIGSSVILPFLNTELEIGVWFIPFIVFVFLATTNSVNLTDGLDGLAGGVGLVYLLGFVFVAYLFLQNQIDLGIGQALIDEQFNLMVVCGAGIGSLLAYLIFNSFPASVFMGDTGSLALGGLIASLAIFSRLTLFILVLGLIFVVTTISVAIQVLYYKKTKKRIFLMAPLHHHFEKKGMNETKIVAIYIIITAIIAVITILFSII